MSFIPAVYLSLGVIEGDHGVQLERIVKLEVYVEPLLRVQVELIVDDGLARPHILDEVQKAARDEPVAVLTMPDRYVPGLLDGQVVRVELRDEEKVALIRGGIDRPESILVYG